MLPAAAHHIHALAEVSRGTGRRAEGRHDETARARHCPGGSARSNGPFAIVVAFMALCARPIRTTALHDPWVLECPERASRNCAKK